MYTRIKAKSRRANVADYAANGGGGDTPSGGAQLVGIVTKGSTFPTTRMDGSPLEAEDYVKVNANTPDTDFPFTIGTVTFTNRKDQAFYVGSGNWMLNPGVLQFTNETPVSDKTQESLSKTAEYQNKVNIEFVEEFKKVITFRGYIKTTAPTGSIIKDSLWYQGSLPTTFPVQVKTWDDEEEEWSATTKAYTPKNFDYFTDLNENTDVYWFNGKWNVLNEVVFTDVDVDETLPTSNINKRTLYRKADYVYKHNDDYLDNEPTGYSITDTENISVSSEGITVDGTLTLWDEVDSALINTLLGSERIATSTYTASAFFNYGTNKYDIASNFDREKKYTLFFNPTATAGQYLKIVNVDNETIGMNVKGEIELKKKTALDKDKGWSIDELGNWILIHIKKWEIVNTFVGVEGNDYILYILTQDVTISDVKYPKGFYTWDMINGFVMRSGASEVFTDIDGDSSLPTTDINDMTIYRKANYTYKHNGVTLENMPTGYKIIDTTDISVSGTGITIDGVETLWEDLTGSVVEELVTNDRLEVSTYTEANFFNYDTSLYDIASNFERETDYTLFYNPTKTADGYIQIDAEVEQSIFEYVDALPSENISDQKIYDLKSYKYYHDSIELNEEPIGYKILDTENISVSDTGITIDSVETLWADLLLATVEDLVANNRLSSSIYDEAEFFNYNSTLFDIAIKFEKVEEHTLYYNPTKTAGKYIEIGGGGKGIGYGTEFPSTSQENDFFYLTLEQTISGELFVAGLYRYDGSKWVLISDNNVFIDVNDNLPTTDIRDDKIYRLKVYEYSHNDIELESEPVGYRILDTENISVSSTGITIDDTETFWDDLNNTIINDLIENDRLEGATFTNADFFNYDSSKYDIATNFSREYVYLLYHNPTKTPSGYKQIGAKGGIAIDNKTITENSSDELQANAIIDLGDNDFPLTDILTKTYYRKNQTVNYIVEEVSKSFTMTKMFLYENGNWVSHSAVTLTEEEYDILPNSMKVDNTTYIVKGAGSLVTQWIYRTLQGLPTIAGITIVGNLTLEDLNLYSRDEILQLLEGKSGTEFVDYLPSTMVKLTWYYSKHYQDGTAVANDKRALYILDKNDVLQFMGIIGEQDLSIYQLKQDNNLQTTNKTIVGGINELNSDKLSLSGGTMTGAILNGIEDIIINSTDNKSTSIYGGSAWGKGAQLQLRGKDKTINGGYFQLYAGDGTNSAELVGKPNGELTWKGELIGGMKAYKKRYGIAGNGTTATISEKVGDDCTIFIVANVRRGVGLYMVVNAGSYGSTVKEIMPVTINSVEIIVNSDRTLTYKNNDTVYQWFDVIVVNNV